MVQDCFKGVGVTKKQGLIRSSLILMASVIVGKAAGLIFKIILANILGGTGMGYFSSAYAVFTPIYALCAASLTPAVAQLVSENEARGNLGAAKGIKSAALRMFTLPSILLSLVPMLFAGFITERFIGNANAKPAVIAILPCVFLGTVTAVYRGYYEGLRNMVPTALSQITESVVRVAAGAGLAFAAQSYSLRRFESGLTVFGVLCKDSGELSDASLPYVAAAAVIGVTLSEVSSFLFMLIRHAAGSDGISPEIRPTAEEISDGRRRLLRLMAPISAAAMVSSLAGSVDLYTIILCIKSSLAKTPSLYAEKYADIIASGVSFKELPNYLYGSFTGLAGTVFGLAPSLCSVFGKSALPNISEAWARKDSAKVSREINRVLTLILVISIPAGLGLSALSEEILGLLFSSRAQEVAVTARPLSIMALGTAFVTAGGAAYSMLQAVGRADLPIRINLFGAFLKLGLNTLLVPVPSLGLSGAALASLISSGAMCALSAGALFRITSTRPKLNYSVVAPTVGGIMAAAGAVFFRDRLTEILPRAQTVGISVSFAVISYIIFVVLLDISTKNKFSSEIFGK